LRPPSARSSNCEGLSVARWHQSDEASCAHYRVSIKGAGARCEPTAGPRSGDLDTSSENGNRHDGQMPCYPGLPLVTPSPSADQGAIDDGPQTSTVRTVAKTNRFACDDFFLVPCHDPAPTESQFARLRLAKLSRKVFGPSLPYGLARSTTRPLGTVGMPPPNVLGIKVRDLRFFRAWLVSRLDLADLPPVDCPAV